MSSSKPVSELYFSLRLRIAGLDYGEEDVRRLYREAKYLNTLWVVHEPPPPPSEDPDAPPPFEPNPIILPYGGMLPVRVAKAIVHLAFAGSAVMGDELDLFTLKDDLDRLLRFPTQVPDRQDVDEFLPPGLSIGPDGAAPLTGSGEEPHGVAEQA